MTELDKDTFDAAVLAHKGVYLVDFWSETCETCAAIVGADGPASLVRRAFFGEVQVELKK